MPQSNVVRLDEYRSRRADRLRLIRALHDADAERSALVGHLIAALELTGADRAAVVQVDDYSVMAGPTVAPFCVVDVVSDRPRTAFSLEPLREAADAGVPGFVDYPDMDRAGATILPEGPRSFAAVCLGSDGMRTWYFVLDSRTPRGPLEEAALRDVMFSAGECSAIVLHRDLPSHTIHGGEADPDEEESQREFRGFPILRDLEGREEDTALRERIGIRFLVGRFLINRARDGFDLGGESARQSGESCLAEVKKSDVPRTDSEFGAWVDVLEGVLESDLDRMTRGAVAVSVEADTRDHLHGAKALLQVAYALTTHRADVEAAIEVTRRLGRVHRRLGHSVNSDRCYAAARRMAELTRNAPALGVVLDGQANTARERGDYERARALLDQMRMIAKDLGDLHLQGLCSHSMMAVEANEGRLFHAARHGWQAAAAFGRGEEYVRALSDLAGVFTMVGEYGAAEDALSEVRRETRSRTFRVAAEASLVTLAGLRGDHDVFFARAEQFDRTVRLEAEAPNLVAQICLERGEVLSRMGYGSQARPWLERALALANRHGYEQVRRDTQTAMAALGGPLGTMSGAPTPNLEEEGFLREARGGVKALANR